MNHSETAITSHFELISLSDLEEITHCLSSSTCQLEISERHSADSWNWIISASLTSLCFQAPSQQVLKIAPSLKKRGQFLDQNFQISNIFYFSQKILEKCVSSQIIIGTQISVVFLKNINQVFMPTTAQRQRSSRTVCTNDLLLTVDSWACAILFFLDFNFIHYFLCMYFIYDLFISFYSVSI